MSRMLQFGYAMQTTSEWMMNGWLGDDEMALALTTMMAARREFGLASYAGACPDCSSGTHIVYVISCEEQERCTCGRIVKLYSMDSPGVYLGATETASQTGLSAASVTGL
jgi:hypothetical protein